MNAAEINALPQRLRNYIHDLETRCDPSGDVQTIAILRDQVNELQAEVNELKRQQEEYLSGIGTTLDQFYMDWRNAQ